MNPLAQRLYELLNTGHDIVSVQPNINERPKTVTFYFRNELEERFMMECDRETFMAWWKEAGRMKRRFRDITLRRI